LYHFRLVASVAGLSLSDRPSIGRPRFPPAQQRRVSRRLFRAAGARTDPEETTIGAMIHGLGDRSFGWSLVLFSVVNMVPMPVGSTLITALPLLLLTGQLALGYRQVALPRFMADIRVGKRRFQGVVIRLKPVFSKIERVLRPRLTTLFSPRNEQLVGMFLFAVAAALFLPMPGSGFVPATALLISAIGLIERDGVVLVSGLALGVVAIIVTAVVAAALLAGLKALGAG
jgi:hypothetical protein